MDTDLHKQRRELTAPSAINYNPVIRQSFFLFCNMKLLSVKGTQRQKQKMTPSETTVDLNGIPGSQCHDPKLL